MPNDEFKAYKYVIYARKSVDETGKEEKSVDQQLKYCSELADRENLNVVKTIKEEHSAKKSSTRPKFNQLLEDIENGKYDGIIAWHPDRLARNMGDGGRIIEMIDNHVISDLRFCTQQFSKDANGKMLLGLSFVLSKQYSDKLSDDVNRGILEKHRAGKAFGRKKIGYEIDDESGRYIKGKMWNLIRKAWQMRLEKKQQVEICDWLNKNGFYETIQSSGKKLGMDTSKLSRIFKNPIYYGVSLLNGEDPIYLSEYYDFPAMITEEEFIQVQRTSRVFEGTLQKDEFWLKGKVVDAEFPDLIEYKPGKTKSKSGKHYLHFKVDSNHKKLVPDEFRSGLKSVRTLSIVETLNVYFSGMKTDYTQEEYNEFLDQAKKYMDERSAEIAGDLRNLRQARTKAKKELHDLSLKFMKTEASQQKKLKKTFDIESKRLEKEIEELKEDIHRLENEDDNLFPKFKSFSNTMKTLSESYLELKEEAMMDIAEIMVSNIFVHNGKVVAVRFKPPFDTLFTDEMSDGWGGGI